MTTDEARAKLFEIFRDLEAHKLDTHKANGVLALQEAVCRAIDRYNRILEAWEPEQATLLGDPQSRAVARVVLSAFATAGIIAAKPPDDALPTHSVAVRAVATADAVMEVLSK